MDADKVWRAATSIVTPSPFTAAYRWDKAGYPTSVRDEAGPEGLDRAEWFNRFLSPVVRRFMVDVGAAEVMTIFDWNDKGIVLQEDRIGQWQQLVKRSWDAHRVPLILVSCCGHANATAAITCLMVPYGGNSNWLQWRRRAWGAPRWDRRVDAIVFRGASTGQPDAVGDATPELTLPRTRAMLALARSGLPADTAFTKVCQMNGREELAEAGLRELGLVAESKSMRSMMAYRYQLMVDGNHGAWSAHTWKLMSGSTNMWVGSTARNWFDEFFEPEVHYVPVRPDVADLVDRYRSIRENPDAGRRMAKACRARARKVFSRRFMRQALRKQWVAAWQASLGIDS